MKECRPELEQSITTGKLFNLVFLEDKVDDASYENTKNKFNYVKKGNKIVLEQN